MSGLDRRISVNLTVVVLVTLALVAGASVRWFSTVIGGDTVPLVVALPASGGVLAGQPVTVRGTDVGTVGGTRLTTDGVDLVLDVQVDAAIPRHIVVQVLRRSPIGEQAVELLPVPADWEPPTDGPVVPSQLPRAAGWEAISGGEQPRVHAVVTPVSVPDVLERADELLTTLDTPSLVTVVDELGLAFTGRADTLRSLTRDATGVGETVLEASDDLERLLDVSAPLLHTIRDQRDALRLGLDSSATLADVVAGRADDVRALLRDAPPALDEASRLLDQQAPNLSCINADLLGLGQLLAEPDTLEALGRLFELNRFFYGGFDAGTQWDPDRPGAIWARVNVLLFEQEGGQPYLPKRSTPPTLPGAHCDSPFGLGVDAVRQREVPPLAPDPTGPGIELAPRMPGAGARADHTALTVGGPPLPR